MNEEEKVIIALLIVGILIFLIYLIYESVKENKLLDNGKEEPEKELQDWEKELEFVKVGEWEEEVRKKMNPIVKIKNKYKCNKDIHILVGDYNKTSVSNTVSVLESMGLNVNIAKSGVEIIKRIKAGEKYDLIISNNIYDRGHCDGPDTVSILKDIDGFNIPIIALTVSENQRNLFIWKYGFDEYMTKLLDQDKILETLPKVIKDLKFTKIQKKSNKS